MQSVSLVSISEVDVPPEEKIKPGKPFRIQFSIQNVSGVLLDDLCVFVPRRGALTESYASIGSLENTDKARTVTVTLRFVPGCVDFTLYPLVVRLEIKQAQRLIYHENWPLSSGSSSAV